jgi:hypothetical protein
MVAIGGGGGPFPPGPLPPGILEAGRAALVDGGFVDPTSKEASMLFHGVTFITPGVDAVTMTNGVRVEWLNSFTYYANRGLYAVDGDLGFAFQGTKFGAEVRSIGSANVYGTYGAVADGAHTLMYLIQHNFAYIGTGLDSSNDPSRVIQENEVVEANSGKIYYQSLDQRGDFRVGSAFVVNQETGFVELNGLSQNTNGITRIVLADENGNITTLDPKYVQSGGIRIQGNTIYGIDSVVNVAPQSNQLTLTQNVSLTKNLSVTGNAVVHGAVYIGNASLDTVGFVADVSSDLLPKLNEAYTLGNGTYKWNTTNVLHGYLPDMSIYDNIIKTTTSNADLELVASGVGSIRVIGQTLRVDNTVNVNGISYLLNTSVTGDINHSGSSNITGTTNQTGDFTLVGDYTLNYPSFNFENIRLNNNTIATRYSNSDLEFGAAGTGVVSVPSNNVIIDRNLTVNGNLLTASPISAKNNITAPSFSDGDILIQDNFITTTLSSSNLELQAHGSAIVESNNNFRSDQNFTVNGITSLRATTVTGDITQTGDSYQSGLETVRGNLSASGHLDISSSVNLDSISITNNVITTTVSNADLELGAAGSGSVNVYGTNLVINNNLSVGGESFVANTTISTTLTADKIASEDVTISGSAIYTSHSNSDLTLKATGQISIPTNNVQLDQNLTVGGSTSLQATTINGDVTVSNVGNAAITHTGNYNLTGVLSVNGNFTNSSTSTISFDDVRFNNNQIYTTNSNSDLELLANGTGLVRLNVPTVSVAANLAVNDTITLQNLNTNKVTFLGGLSDGDILVKDNFITTTASNSNLELRAQGTGILTIPFNRFDINSLSVTGTTALKNTNIVGDKTHTGNLLLTGDMTTNGYYGLVGDITVSKDANFDSIAIVGNTVSTTLSNADLELRAAGSGKVTFPNDSVQIFNNLNVSDVLYATTVGTDYVTADSLYTSINIVGTSETFDGSLTFDGDILTFDKGSFDREILIKDNFITNLIPDVNLTLLGNLAGGVLAQGILINDNVIKPNVANDLILSPDASIDVISTSALKVPVGTTVQRPTGVTGELRFNSTRSKFEGWTVAAKPLNGVYSANLSTNVTATDTNQLNFVAAGTAAMEVTGTKIRANGIKVDSYISISGNTITNALNEDINITPNGTGIVVLGQSSPQGNAFVNLSNSLPITLATTGQGYVKFNTKTAIVIPHGDTSTRPISPEVGDFRWNTETNEGEIFNGVSYASLAGNAVTATRDQIQDLNQVYSLIFG